MQLSSAAPRLAAYEALRRLLDALVTDLMDAVRARVAALGATTLDDIRRAPTRLAALSPEMEALRASAKKFLYASLYNSPGMEDLHAHAEQVIQQLFAFLMADPACSQPTTRRRSPPKAWPAPWPTTSPA